MDILDPQYRVRIPQLLRLERFAENLDQRCVIGIVIGIAAPVGHRAVQLISAVRAEMQNAFSASNNRDSSRGSCRPRPRRRMLAPFARQRRSSRPGSTRSRCRKRRASRTRCHCNRVSHFAILGDVKRNRPLVAGSVDHGDGAQARCCRQTARPRRKTRHGCHGAACRSAARHRRGRVAGRGIRGVRRIWSMRRRVDGRRAIKREV